MRKIALSILLSLIVGASPSLPVVSAEETSLPVVELLGDDYYVYKTKKGDSLFGIARRFGWDDKKLQELNPSAVSPLKKGMKIYYPAVSHKKENGHPVSKKVGDTEILHKVKRGETVYAVAGMYGVSVDRIYKLNPGSKNGIKAGETLVINKSDKNSVTQSPIIGSSEDISRAEDENAATGASFYSVKAGDTLYDVAQEYGVSVSSIMSLNPGVDSRNLHAGETIKMPAKGSGLVMRKDTIDTLTFDSIDIHQVSKGETWESIASDKGVSVKLLKDSNPDVKTLKNKSYISVPLVDTISTETFIIDEDPREETESGLEEIYNEVHKLTASEGNPAVRAAIIIENSNSKKDMEFLRGFITGIDNLKQDGYPISLKVIDGSLGKEKVVGELSNFKPALAFITSDDDIPAYIRDYAAESRTPVVNCFDVKSQLYISNPYIVQLLTPPALFNENVADYVYDRYKERTLIFVGTPDSDDLLAESLRKLWDKSRIKTATIADIVPERFRSDGKYLIYSYPVRKSEVEQLLGNVASVKEQRPLADIDMLGRPNLIVYEDALAGEFGKAGALIPSRFYIDKDSSEYNDFLSRYKSLFVRNPVKSLPLFAASGFDNAMYFLRGLAEADGDINNLKASSGTIQSDFDLSRVSNWGGFVNPPVFLIRYTPYGTIEKNVISFHE